jgi:nucleoside-diphosphate-sugar epimerase
MFHALFDTPAVILRPSFAYGPGQEATKLVPHVITRLLGGESPELSSGERKIDFVYAPDVAEAYVAAASAPGVEGMTIDIGAGHLSSVRDVVAEIVRLIGPVRGAPVFGRVPVRPLEKQIEVDPDVAVKTLGWRSRTSLDEGLRRTIDWYREDVAQAAPDATTR